MKATYRTIQDGQVYEAGEVIPYMGSIVCTKIRSGGRVREYTFLSEDFTYLPKYDSLESGSKAYATDTDGTWGTPENTKYNVVSKTAAGLAPQLPNETSTTKYLRQDGTWAVPPNQTYNKATQSSDGLMAKEDKTKLDGIEEGAQKNEVSYGSVSVDDGLPMGAVQPNDTLSIKSGDNVTVEVVSDGGGGDGNSLIRYVSLIAASQDRNSHQKI